MAENSEWGYAPQTLVDPDHPEGIMDTGQTISELEVAWLRQVSGISGLASLSDLRYAVYGGNERAYWAALSGLSEGTLVDHKLARMRSVSGSTGTLVDAARAFYLSQVVG